MARTKKITEEGQKLSELLSKAHRETGGIFGSGGDPFKISITVKEARSVTMLSPEGLYAERKYRRYPVPEGAVVELDFGKLRIGKTGPILCGELEEPIMTAKTGTTKWSSVEFTIPEIEAVDDMIVSDLISVIERTHPHLFHGPKKAEERAADYEDHQHWGTW